MLELILSIITIIFLGVIFAVTCDQLIKMLDYIKDERWSYVVIISFMTRFIFLIILTIFYSLINYIFIDSSFYKLLLYLIIPGILIYGNYKKWYFMNMYFGKIGYFFFCWTLTLY